MKYSLDPIGKFLFTTDSDNNFHSYDGKPAVIYLDTLVCIWMINGKVDENKGIEKRANHYDVRDLYIKKSETSTLTPTTTSTSIPKKSNYYGTSYGDLYKYATTPIKTKKSTYSYDSYQDSYDVDDSDYILKEPYLEKYDKLKTKVGKSTLKKTSTKSDEPIKKNTINEKDSSYYYKECRNSVNPHHTCSDYCLDEIYKDIDKTLL